MERARKERGKREERTWKERGNSVERARKERGKSVEIAWKMRGKSLKRRGKSVYWKTLGEHFFEQFIELFFNLE